MGYAVDLPHIEKALRIGSWGLLDVRTGIPGLTGRTRKLRRSIDRLQHSKP